MTAIFRQAKGFTLLEVLVSAILLALILTGTANIFILGKRLIVHSRSRMVASELGKLFLAPLHAGVRVNDWSTAANPLQAGTRYCDSEAGHTQQPVPVCPSLANRTLDNIVFSAQYTITDVSSPSRTEPDNMRRVVATIRWNEPI